MSGQKLQEEKALAVKAEAGRILSFLAAQPTGVSSAERPVVREIMLSTDGSLMAGGRLYDIAAKNRGAGVYRLNLKERV